MTQRERYEYENEGRDYERWRSRNQPERESWRGDEETRGGWREHDRESGWRERDRDSERGLRGDSGHRGGNTGGWWEESRSGRGGQRAGESRTGGFGGREYSGPDYGGYGGRESWGESESGYGRMPRSSRSYEGGGYQREASDYREFGERSHGQGGRGYSGYGGYAPWETGRREYAESSRGGQRGYGGSGESRYGSSGGYGESRYGGAWPREHRGSGGHEELAWGEGLSRSSYGSGAGSGRREESRRRREGRGPKGYQRSDERIKEDVSECLRFCEDVDASNIEVEVSGGEVTLKGSVRDRQEKRRAEAALDDISGVKEINNQIRVDSGSQQETGEGETIPYGRRSQSTQSQAQTGQQQQRSATRSTT